MRRKLKKEAPEVIIQKIANDVDGKILADFLKIASCVRNQVNGELSEVLKSTECQEVLKNIQLLYGYENEIQELLEKIKDQLKMKVFSKSASHVTIMSSMACYCVLLSIFDADYDLSKWDEAFDECENKKTLACVEILKRHCPDEIDVSSFCEARRYIRIWDSTYNW